MDGGASTALQLRIEQQRQWELAASVRDGSQPSVDPDTHRLVEIRKGERVYRGAEGSRFVKRLTGGTWHVEEDHPDIVY